MNRVLKLTLVISTLPCLAIAAQINQTQNSTNSQNWNVADVWGGQAPTSGNTYNTNGHTLVVFGTEDSANPNRFAGDSLTLSSGSILQTRGSLTTSYWSANLILAGGELSTSLGNNATLHIGGTISVVADTAIKTTSSREGFSYVFDGALSGTNRLIFSGGNANGNALVINNAASTFNGTFEIWGSNRLVFGYDYSGTAAVIRLAGNSSILDLSRDISIKSLILNNSEIMLTAGNTYTYSDLLELDASLGSRLLDNGGTLTIVPEPGATTTVTALIALGLIAGRRRFSKKRFATAG